LTYTVAQSIGLVACCGEKLSMPAAAADMYRSQLFRKSRALVKNICKDWAILSARHGLLMPRQTIEPYNETLAMLTPGQRIEWAARVRVQLLACFGHGPFYVLAGEHYRGCVELKLALGHGHESDPLPFKAPLRGLGIGQQLAWLTKQLQGLGVSQ
jgi:hypothetical protein